MSSFLDVDGVFNPTLRFAFTNITSDDFRSAWGGSPVLVKPGQSIEVPHHLAVKFTRELVDKIMIGNAKLDEAEKNQPYYRSHLGMALGVPASRKIWEDKILRSLAVDEESPEIQVLRAQIKEELIKDLNAQPGVPTESAPSTVEEFSQIKTKGSPIKAPEEKKSLKVKSIKIK